MAGYHQLARSVALGLLIFTVVLAGMVVALLGLGAALFAFVTAIFEIPTTHVPLGKIFGITAPVLTLAGYLVWFYSKVLLGRVTAPLAILGWTVSALAYAAATYVFTFISRATIGTGDDLRIPLRYVTGTAVLFSIYLLLRYPRPPTLPSPLMPPPLPPDRY